MTAFHEELKRLIVKQIDGELHEFYPGHEKANLVEQRFEELARKIWDAFGEEN